MGLWLHSSTMNETLMWLKSLPGQSHSCGDKVALGLVPFFPIPWGLSPHWYLTGSKLVLNKSKEQIRKRKPGAVRQQIIQGWHYNRADYLWWKIPSPPVSKIFCFPVWIFHNQPSLYYFQGVIDVFSSESFYSAVVILQCRHSKVSKHLAKSITLHIKFSFNCFFKNGPKELEILEALQHFHPKDGRAKNM